MTDQITVSRALLQQAIDALSDTQKDGESPQWDIEKAAYDALRTALEQPAPVQEPVHGDILPPIGSRVFIRHGRDDGAHACTVTGYYAWPDLGRNKRLTRLFVRMVYEGTKTQQARMLCDCFATEADALAAPQAQQPAPVQEPVAALRRVMSRLADLLDEDQFAEMENIVLGAGVAPQAQQPRKMGGVDDT